MKRKSRKIIEILIFLFNIVFIFIGGFIANNIMNSPAITFSNSTIIQDLSISSITISSIFLVTILAISAILVTKAQSIPKRHIGISILPIIAIMAGFFSQYYSYFETSFQISRNLLGISMMCTIVTTSLLFSIFAWHPRILFEGISIE